MEENKEHSASKSRPSDVEVFLHMLPAIVGSLATKHTDARTVRDLAIGVAREVTGQLVSLGICERTTVCLDSQYLAAPGAAVAASQPAPLPVLGSNNGHGIQGAMVAHWPSKEEVKIPTL